MKLEISIEELRDLTTPAAPSANTNTHILGANGLRYTPDEIAHLIGDIQRNNKISAIKLYWIMTGAGLMEAKSAVERYWNPSPY